MIVFVLYKKEAARVETFLQRKGWKVRSREGGRQKGEEGLLARWRGGGKGRIEGPRGPAGGASPSAFGLPV